MSRRGGAIELGGHVICEYEKGVGGGGMGQ